MTRRASYGTMYKNDSFLSKPSSHPQVNDMALCVCICLEMHRKKGGRQHHELALITYRDGDGTGAEREGRKRSFYFIF